MPVTRRAARLFAEDAEGPPRLALVVIQADGWKAGQRVGGGCSVAADVWPLDSCSRAGARVAPAPSERRALGEVPQVQVNPNEAIRAATSHVTDQRGSDAKASIGVRAYSDSRSWSSSDKISDSTETISRGTLSA
jgi:hypothetical protein